MASKNLGNWGTWQQTRNTLVLSLSLNIEERNNAALGSITAAELTTNIQKTLDDMQTHAMNGLKMVDLEIANSGLLGNIKTQSAAAKREADRIKNGTRSVQCLSNLTTKLTKIVGLFSGL